MMHLRIFNAGGIAHLEKYLQSVRSGGRDVLNRRESILNNPDLSDVVRRDSPVFLENNEFANTTQAMQYLHGKLSGITGVGVIGKNAGLWAWLALFYFNQLCSVNERGECSVGVSARWIPDFQHSRHFHHLLLGPYLCYLPFRDNPERARVLLSHRLNREGVGVMGIGSRQELVTSDAVVEAAGDLYVGEDGKFKRGVTGKDGIRRFVEVMQQFALTWDLYSMPKETLLDMLPGEFDCFRQ